MNPLRLVPSNGPSAPTSAQLQQLEAALKEALPEATVLIEPANASITKAERAARASQWTKLEARLAELGIDAEPGDIVDRETYFQVFPEHAPYTPEGPPGFETDGFLLMPAPRAARHRVDWTHVLEAFIPSAGLYALTRIEAFVAAWLRQRRRGAADDEPLSQKAVLYGPDGKVLSIVEVNARDGDDFRSSSNRGRGMGERESAAHHSKT